MRSIAVVMGMVAALVGCTKPNPRSCADGSCSDPGFPFCDADGSLEGQPNICIAVDCTPNEVVACRGDDAVRCNATGNNYDLVQCQLGCDLSAGGCQSCASSEQCGNPTPVCDDAEHMCRACEQDDECVSGICDAGACTPVSSVIYASPTGMDSGLCTPETAACSLAHALALATTPSPAHMMRLLPGIYTQPFDVTSPAQITVVATGAQFGPSSELHVTGGANVAMRGIVVRSDNKNVMCGGVGGAVSSLSLSDSSIAVANTVAINVLVGNCTLRISTSELTADPRKGQTLLGTTDDATVEIDRSRLLVSSPQPNDYAYISTLGKRVNVKVTNSVFDRIGLTLGSGDTVAPGNKGYFAFNTFVYRSDATQGPLIYCPNPSTFNDVRLEDNVLLTLDGSPDTIGGNRSGCIFEHNIIFPQTSTIAGSNVIADPQLVDAAAGNFHLKPTSPAVDAAMPTTGLTTDHDFEGTARPQGAKPDIGAYELVP